jgi:hypothetical protein
MPNKKTNHTGLPQSPPRFGLDTNAQESIRKHFFPNSPDESQIARFFEVLGRAITVWQLVEAALYEVYERAVAPMRPGACGASFHAIQTFNLKLSVTDAAVRFSLVDREKLRSEWKTLFKNAQDKSKRRNEFAHFSTFIMFNEKHTNDKIRLEPPMYDWRFIGERPKVRLSEITEITKRFIDLANDLQRFKGKIPHANQLDKGA